MTGRLATLAAIVALVSACALLPSNRAAAPDRAGNPLAGARFYVDPNGHAPQQVRALQRSGAQHAADDLQPIARQPTAVWFTNQQADPEPAAATLTRHAATTGRVPVLTVYNLPGRDCGQYSRGGAATPEQYRAWLDRLAHGIQARRAVVVLEPDAIPHTLTRCPGAPPAQQRYQLLAWAVSTLRAQAPAALVYLDAGNASWITDLPALAHALRLSNSQQAAGFALNVSNFHTTADSAAYGRRLSALLGGAHFVIDTSRNGNGPPPFASDHDNGHWCNPPGRALGAAPTSHTGLDQVDALLWVKQPGDSDGTCGGGPPAGTWWPALAHDLLH